MKKLLCTIIALCCLLLLCACSDSRQTQPQKRWDCTVTCVEESADGTYVITYSDETIVSTTGTLTIENKNNFDIVVHLTSNSNERIEEIPAGGISTLFQIAVDTEYKLGFHADVPENTEIVVLVYDGEGNILSD